MAITTQVKKAPQISCDINGSSLCRENWPRSNYNHKQQSKKWSPRKHKSSARNSPFLMRARMINYISFKIKAKKILAPSSTCSKRWERILRSSPRIYSALMNKAKMSKEHQFLRVGLGNINFLPIIEDGDL
jgi:hypothetical protein